METHSKNTGFGGLSRRRCLAIEIPQLGEPPREGKVKIP